MTLARLRTFALWELSALRASGQLLPDDFYRPFRGRDWWSVAAPNAYPALRHGWPFWRLVGRGILMRALNRLRAPTAGQ